MATWTMKTGEKVKVKDMTDLHLLNTIRFLHRQVRKFAASLPYPMMNGEMAQEQAEREYDAVMEDPGCTSTRYILYYGKAGKEATTATRRAVPRCLREEEELLHIAPKAGLQR